MSRSLFCYREMNGGEKIVLWVKLSIFWLAGLGLSTFLSTYSQNNRTRAFVHINGFRALKLFTEIKQRLASRSLFSSPSIPSLSLFQSFHQCLYHSVVLPLCYFIHNTRMHSHFPRRMTLNKGRDVEGFVSGCCFPSVRLLLFKCLHRTAQGLETSLNAVVKWHSVKSLSHSPFPQRFGHGQITLKDLLISFRREASQWPRSLQKTSVVSLSYSTERTFAA